MMPREPEQLRSLTIFDSASLTDVLLYQLLECLPGSHRPAPLAAATPSHQPSSRGCACSN